MIGLRMGPNSVIDIEADSAIEEQIFVSLFDGCEIPVTTTYTSTRGKHRFFLWDNRLAETDAAVVNVRGREGAKLGIRIGAGGKGAQSIIPPSPGRQWLGGLGFDQCDPAPLPDIVVRRILAAAEKPKANGKASSNGHASPDALAAMLRHRPDANEHDSSKRLLAVCCRAVEFDLSDESAISTIREYETQCPFASAWSDDDIVRRLRDAEQLAERGSAVTISNFTTQEIDGDNGEKKRSPSRCR